MVIGTRSIDKVGTQPTTYKFRCCGCAKEGCRTGARLGANNGIHTEPKWKGDGAEVTSNNGVFLNAPCLRIYKTHRITRMFTKYLLTVSARDTSDNQEEPELTVVSMEETGPTPDL